MDSSTTCENNSHHNKWARIVAKAWMDPQFKKELLTHPEKILREYGIDVCGKRPKIIENTMQEIYFVLPMKPEEFSEVDLKNISGGLCYGTNNCDV